MYFALNLIPMQRGNNSIYHSFVFHYLSISREYLFVLHKIFGYLFIFCCLCHWGFWEYFFIMTDNYDTCVPFDLYPCQYSPNNPAIPMQYFLFTFVAIPVYLIFSNYRIRRKIWELFYYIHLCGNWIVLGGLLWHANQFIYFLYPTLSFYVIDRILRFIQSAKEYQLLTVSKLTIDYETNDCITELRFRSLEMIQNGNNKHNSYATISDTNNFEDGFLRNDFCFIKIDNISLFQWHPCSVFSFDAQSCEYCVYFKTNGDFTKKLSKFAKKSKKNDIVVNSIAFHCDGMYYKRIDYTLYKKCIFLIAGGIGVTPIHYLLRQLMNINEMDGAGSNTSNVERPQNIVVIWSFESPNMYKLCKETFDEIAAMTDIHENIQIKLFCTCPSADFSQIALGLGNGKFGGMNGVCTVVNARANIYDVVTEQCKEMELDINDKQEMQQCLIYGCGPKGMIDSMRDTAFGLRMGFDCESFEL